MYETKRVKNLIFITVVAIVAIIAVVVVVNLINAANDKNKKDAIYISNLSSCSSNMQKSLEDSMRANMYITIQSANEYNKKETLPRYESVIRDGSCTEKDISIGGIDGKKADIKESVAILDIPEAKQSWTITYHWVENGTPITTDLGTIVIPSCVPKEKLIYGDFNCEKIMSLAEYGTDKYDAILQYMPYTGKGFDLSYNPDTKAVAAEIIVQPSQINNQELLTNLRGQVEYWFTHRKLDINSYTVTYTYTDTSSHDHDEENF